MYVAELHKDEAVLPKSEAERYRKGNVVNNNTSTTASTKNSESNSSSNVFYINIEGKNLTTMQILDELVPALKLRMANL